MTGSENQQKTSKPVEVQLPLKGFFAPIQDQRSKRNYVIEGMGGGRFRIHTRKRQPKLK